MKVLWVLAGLLMALWQFLLDLAMARRPGKLFRGLMLAGKLVLWVLFFVLLARGGDAARMLSGGLPALGGYTLCTILWMAHHVKKEKGE